jgi:hypothetical protein
MKLLATAVFAGMMAFGTAACAKEEPKKEVAAEVKKDTAPTAAPAPETKQVCLDVQGKDGKPVIDPKTKKPKQNCTTVKVRQKFEGTKIEDAKKK